MLYPSLHDRLPHPLGCKFRDDCLLLLDRAYQHHVVLDMWSYTGGGLDLTYMDSKLIVRTSSDRKIIWHDSLDGMCVADLTPYEEMLSRLLILDRLAEL